MKIAFKIPKEAFTKAYLKVWNCTFMELTDKELDIMAAILDIYLDLSTNVKQEYIYSLLFNSSNRKKIRQITGINSEQSFNNYFMKLKQKKLIKEDDNGNYSIDARLIPQSEITFEFKIIE